MLHTHIMLPCCPFSCTCTHTHTHTRHATLPYVVLQLHICHATVLYVLLHLRTRKHTHTHTYVMLRCCPFSCTYPRTRYVRLLCGCAFSCACTHVSCEAAVHSLCGPFSCTPHASLLSVLLRLHVDDVDDEDEADGDDDDVAGADTNDPFHSPIICFKSGNSREPLRDPALCFLDLSNSK